MKLRDVISKLSELNELDDISIASNYKDLSPDAECDIGQDLQSDNKIIVSVYELEDIILNLKEQKENYSESDYIRAIKFYINNDAFIEIN